MLVEALVDGDPVPAMAAGMALHDAAHTFVGEFFYVE